MSYICATEIQIYMFYKFNEESLQFEKVKLVRWASLVFVAITTCSSFIPIGTRTITNKVEMEPELTLTINKDEFSQEKLKQQIKDLNIAHGDIVFAQFKLESANFKSKMFKENNNFAGMKMASQRPTVAVKLLNNHAYYDNWRDCVIDYALYQAAYLRGLSRSQYIEYLSSNYAEDPNYINKVLKLI